MMTRNMHVAMPTKVWLFSRQVCCGCLETSQRRHRQHPTIQFYKSNVLMNTDNPFSHYYYYYSFHKQVHLLCCVSTPNPPFPSRIHYTYATILVFVYVFVGLCVCIGFFFGKRQNSLNCVHCIVVEARWVSTNHQPPHQILRSWVHTTGAAVVVPKKYTG